MFNLFFKTMGKKKSEAVSVLSPNGDFIRTYSESEHGEDFRKLAESFASKVEGRQIVDAE